MRNWGLTACSPQPALDRRCRCGRSLRHHFPKGSKFPSKFRSLALGGWVEPEWAMTTSGYDGGLGRSLVVAAHSVLTLPQQCGWPVSTPDSPPPVDSSCQSTSCLGWKLGTFGEMPWDLSATYHTYTYDPAQAGKNKRSIPSFS